MSEANGNSLHSLVGHSLASGVGEQVVYTPDALAAGIVGHFRPTGRLCEPCKGGGAFLRAMPGADWFEIAEGRDFLTAAGRWDWIVTNPPWRELGPFLDKAMDCADNVVFLAWSAAWWSKARQRKIEAAGFGMAEMLLCPTPPKPWPQSGFLLGAVWLRRGWHGGMTISRMPNSVLCVKTVCEETANKELSPSSTVSPKDTDALLATIRKHVEKIPCHDCRSVPCWYCELKRLVIDKKVEAPK